MYRRVGMAIGVCLVLAISSTALASGEQTGFTEIPGERMFSGEMIARPIQPDAWARRGLDEAEANRRAAAARLAMTGFVVNEYVWQNDEYIFQVPAGQTENQVANQLMATGNFQYVEPNWIVYPVDCPNDPMLNQQWQHNADIMQSCDGWDIHTGEPSVTVGICDTGIRTTHEDLQLHRMEGYNAVDRIWESDGGRINDIFGSSGHGTITTGCAAANGDNGIGVAGVGWHLSHRMLRVSNSGGGSTIAILNHAARTAVETGDRIASLSYSSVSSPTNRTTATYIKSIGGLMVWAAGNSNRNLNWGNRDDDDLIVAGGTDRNDNKASFSSFGPSVDLVAPAVDVFSTNNTSDRGYGNHSGTSFACPLTAGLCALIWSADPSLTPDEVEEILKAGSDDLGADGVDNIFGYGRINLFGSLSLIERDCDPCDMDCDGKVNALDIEPFLGILFDGDEPCAPCTGDANGDDNVDAFDIEPFLACLFP